MQTLPQWSLAQCHCRHSKKNLQRHAKSAQSTIGQQSNCLHWRAGRQKSSRCGNTDAEWKQFDNVAAWHVQQHATTSCTAIIRQSIFVRLSFVVALKISEKCTTSGTLHSMSITVAVEGTKRGRSAWSRVQMFRYNI